MLTHAEGTYDTPIVLSVTAIFIHHQIRAVMLFMHSDRVHIVPVRFEHDRVVEPLLKYRADIVYLLYDSRHDTRPEYYDTLETTLETEGLHPGETLHRLECNHGDPYEVFGLVTTLAAEHDGDDVAVNVATGSKLAAIGAAMGCMDEDTDAQAYFPHAADRAFDGYVEPATSSYEGDTELLDYPIQSPARQQVAMLAVIAVEQTGTAQVKKRTLIDHGLWLSSILDHPLAFTTQIVDVDTPLDPHGEIIQFSDLTSNKKKGAYGSLGTHITTPLLDRGYISIEEHGRSDIITLTPTGEKTLQAFRHKITDVIRALESKHDSGATGAVVPAWLSDGLDETV